MKRILLTNDDGIYAILRLFEILQETKKNLGELIKIFPKKHRSQEIRILCPEEEKTRIVEYVKNIFLQKKMLKPSQLME